MQQLRELGLETYPQYTEGKTLQQLGGDAIHSYTGDIPALPWYALLDLHLFIRKVRKEVNQMVGKKLEAKETKW